MRLIVKKFIYYFIAIVDEEKHGIRIVIHGGI